MKTHLILHRSLLGAGLVLAAITAQAQVDPVVPPGRNDYHKIELRGSDKSFAEKTAKASMAEVGISRVAASRTSNPQVRDFAEQMAADHARLNDELAALAAKKGVSLPAKDNVAEKWTKQNAKNFDRDYLKKMVDDHEDAVKAFQKQALDGSDPDLVSFARKHLASLQHHLQRAKDLERFLKD